MRYVEAMLGEVQIPFDDGGFEIGALTEHMNTLRAALRPDDTINSTDGDALSAKLATAWEAFEIADRTSDDMMSAIEEHSCATNAAPQLIPVSSHETINVQMERAGFLNGEVVVIIRERDFTALQKFAKFTMIDATDTPHELLELAQAVMR